MILTVAGLKGGVGKTTTAAYAAHALAEQGRRVLVLDADEQASLRTWADWGRWTVPVEPFHPARAAQVHPLGRDVVIDTPPRDERATAAAVATATHVLYPLAPTGVEFERVDAMRALLDRHAPRAVRMILLVRTVAGASSTADYRAALVAEGWRVAAATVNRRESIAQSFGAIPYRAAATAYGDALAELQQIGAPA